ncbi:hypothetical protein Pmar_PMAR009716 [Perkinsus marinus ATCC 50983]|uniref:Uncharacterized protein n=1 Tax=Perkinsus marinus (strain ATCC 50983 / TXsc) TaxID=423536 RepID=C5L226_PERM5|nr:hypothetical protein Pmar_PMAR009716 [Perkinsus marinus ATCC 50983]EER09219.1 hypothetical protein Pmar_PMAR009716 [Perkinsus marinus ATCC 50983]|eukprot:XP_002777403.1 hypothetical protein Pmar_PMAR009716 [Perkinsus marinus ATCC 50983]
MSQGSLSVSSTASWTHPARHLLAQCCEILSRFEEGIRALVLSYDDEEGTLPLVIANGAAGAFLLGQLYEKNAQYHLALPAYEKSLEAGPVMFAAYERIISLRRRGVGADSKGTAEVFLEPETCFGVDRLNSWYTSASTSNTMIATADSLISDQRIARRPPPPPNQASSETITVSHNNSSMIPSTVSMRGLQSTRKGAEEEQEMKSPATCVKSFAYLYKATAHLDLPSARMVTSDRMTPGQRDSRYTTLRLAEAAFDRGEYEEAEAFFDALFTTYPFAIEGVGKYSTLLWHEKRKRALVDLSRRVLTFGRLRSESWICAANADSINLDHAEARQKLEKARLLNPCDANVCCLIGHE